MTRLSPSGERVEVWAEVSPKAMAEVSPKATNETEAPIGFDWQGKPHRVLEVCNRWRIHARWWEHEQTVWREYFKVTTDSGLLCLIYHDLQSGNWYLSRIYD